ncbi:MULTISPECIES: hypothetical protein [unclassified Streptomyces]|uniref:hypothetical protein n=1 Tax=Streptomyces TaxID=1883 RepID=UPI0013DC03ED|nr:MULTISPECIES: hypothetical protein [unclassified Streptomyces]KAF2776618.1 hypothetical protein STPH1_1277 [Streptomyces sp. OM5714]NHI06294.1 hypothetical protein [Streptomyces sp. KO7888]
MRRRLATVLTVLLTVLLPLVPAWPAAGSHAGARGPLAAAAATAVPHPALDLHADDGCTPVCAAQPRARHDLPAGRPTAPDQHPATTAHPEGCAAPGGHVRTSFAPGPVPVSPGRASHDSGRAPPVSSGI